ncbi:MAG TPA: acetylornithine deacetylase [Alphaproteobacteria bacterium]|nr:acetylornithine deacetylase [Alphaproteobacteria bacterium]
MRRPSAASLDMIRRLIAFDTTSRDSNLALIEFVRDYLADLGVASELFFDESGTKANLFATLGPSGDGGIILSGHTDVVPVDGQDWSSDPFAVVERNGRLYGRGTCDMKSFIAVALALSPELLERKPRTPVHLAFSYDEEVGCLGVRGMLSELVRRGIRPIGCVVGEPTEMRPIRAHKGKLSLRCEVHGFECHSALAPRGVNAIQYAADIIAELNRIGRRFRDAGPYDREFDVPYTTVHTGVIRGGTALNIVPKDCWFDFEIRHLPADDPHSIFGRLRDFVDTTLTPEMRRVAPASGVTWRELSRFPGLSTDENAEITQIVKSASGGNSTGKVAFGTEAGLYQGSGIPTIVCGPGSIDQAHKPDEFVALEQIALCEEFIRRLVLRAASRA